MSARDDILARIARAAVPGAPPLPEVPAFEAALPSLEEAFVANLARMGGQCFASDGKALQEEISARFPEAKVFCSATPEFKGHRTAEAGGDPRALDDVDVGVVRARFGVAETGSVWLSEAELKVNALAFLAQHLVVLLSAADLVPNLHSAYRHAGFREARYAILMSGPSATADIEGVLVRGAQGVRSLTVCLLS